MSSRWKERDDERGAVLIHVAFGVLALTAFTTFVADYGLLWVSRRQAQNSADAGAIAGATALGYDDPLDLSDTGPAKTNAHLATQMNLVWGQAPNVNITTDITFPTGPVECTYETGESKCIRVDVYRNQARGNSLPMLFGQIVGVSQQGIRATATAVVAIGNSSNCLKPWGLADKWAEGDGTWDPTDTFDPTASPPDDYRPQGTNGPSDPGTGFHAPPTTPNDFGVELTLKVGSPSDAINPGWFQALDLGVCGHGASCYRDEISGCVNSPYGIGDDVPKKNGNMVGPTAQGTSDLIDLDPAADWYDPDGPAGPQVGSIINSCVNHVPYNCSQPGLLQSPRVVAIPVFDLELYMATGGPGNGTVRIVNILGFFVDRIVSGDVVGYLINKTDTFDPTKGGVAGGASFIKSVMLIR